MNDGRKKKAPKHKNKTAFKIQFDTLALDMQKKVSLTLLCKRCHEQMNWKLQFNKYKKITQPGKCNYCHEKVVVRSYMKACDPCAEEHSVCPKCLDAEVEILEGDQVKLSVKQQAERDRLQEKAMNDFIDSLRQRSRRKVKREYEKGIITWDNQNKYFIDAEGNQLVGLRFKSKGLEDLQKQMEEDLEEGGFDEQDEQDEEIREKGDDLCLQVQGKALKIDKQEKGEGEEGEGEGDQEGLDGDDDDSGFEDEDGSQEECDDGPEPGVQQQGDSSKGGEGRGKK